MVSLVTPMVYMHTFHQHARTITTYINEQLQFYEEHSKNQGNIGSRVNITQKLGVMFAYHFFRSCYIIPFAFVFGIHYEKSCKPSLVGYWLLEECRSEFTTGWPSIHGILIKVVIYFVNLWLWTIMVCMYLLGISVLRIICIVSVAKWAFCHQQL